MYSSFISAQGVSFEMDSINSSKDGYIKLIWNDKNEEGVYEVQEANSSSFSTPRMVYEGPDRATFVSGLENGVYHYRVRRVGGEWAESVILTVDHHSLELAFTLFGLGVLVFLLTVFVVVKGTREQSSSTTDK